MNIWQRWILRARFGHYASRPIGKRAVAGDLGFYLVVHFKMLMVGFFENLRSERAIAARCEGQPVGAGVSGIRFGKRALPITAA